jgi:hypothetical protein
MRKVGLSSGGQVQRASFLAQLGRREIHRQALAGKLQPAVLDRGAHALPSFLDRCGGEPDQEELDLSMSDIRLNFDAADFKSGEGARIDRSKHAPEANQREAGFQPSLLITPRTQTLP